MGMKKRSKYSMGPIWVEEGDYISICALKQLMDVTKTSNYNRLGRLELHNNVCLI